MLIVRFSRMFGVCWWVMTLKLNVKMRWTEAYSFHSISPCTPLPSTPKLQTPSITKWLISIAHLCLYNNVVVEFYSSHIFVKDIQTKKILSWVNLKIGYTIFCWVIFPQDHTKKKNRQVVEVGLSLLTHSHLHLCFWTCAFQSVVHIINRLIMLALHYSIPYQLLYKYAPDFALLKSFGCACFPLCPFNTHKLQYHSVERIFLGYNVHYKDYLCLNSYNDCVYVSQHVILNEC